MTTVFVGSPGRVRNAESRMMPTKSTTAIAEIRKIFFLSFVFLTDFFGGAFFVFFFLLLIKTSLFVFMPIVPSAHVNVNGYFVNIPRFFKKGIRKIKKHLHFGEKCIILCVAMMGAIVCEAPKRADGWCESVRGICVSTPGASGESRGGRP